MSTGRPPAADVASIAISASPEPSGRCTGTATPVEVSLCAQAMRSTDGSDCGFGALPGVGLDDDRVADERVLGHRRGELAAELAVGQVQRALVDQPERGGIPERRRAAVAEDDLVAVGQREELAQPVADPADQVLDRRLPVRRAEQVARGGQRQQLFGADLGGAASEAAVAGFEVGGNREVGHAVKSSDRTLCAFCGEGGQKRRPEDVG